MTAMAKAPLTYCKAGVTPGWERAAIFDRDAGDFVSNVVEVNVVQGCLLRHQTDDKGNLLVDANGHYLVELLRGRFAIILRPKGRHE